MITMAFENYIKEYVGMMEEIRKETRDKYPIETGMLFEFIDNWIDLFPKGEEKFLEAINSLSGIILFNSWKLTNWISYEILSGKYFEAIRNLRFVFEGSVYAAVIEDAIESRVFANWRTLSTLDLKAEIFQLWEECKSKKVYKKGKFDHDKIKNIVVDFVNRNIDSSKKSRAQDYTEVYVQILSNGKLYLSTSRMIEECSSFLKLNETDVQKLKELWHELSAYLHFSHPYLEALIEDPESLFLEKFDDDLFKRSLHFYFQTLDLFYAVLAWRFENLRKEINKMCDWWKDNFNKRFVLTEKILKQFKVGSVL